MKKNERERLLRLAGAFCDELCRWPYIAPSQEILDVICDGCEVMDGINEMSIPARRKKRHMGVAPVTPAGDGGRADIESAPTGDGARADMESAPTGDEGRADMESAPTGDGGAEEATAKSAGAMGSEGKEATTRKRRGPEPPKPVKPTSRVSPPERPRPGAAAEKRAVLERLTAYRQARGRGSLRGLAKASGVRESVIWDMLDCAVVPIEDWRAVGAALEKIERREEGVK